MNTTPALPLTVLTTTAVIAETVNFDAEKVGGLPDGWVAGVTGRGTPKWLVVADPTAPSKHNVLKQSGSGTFPWCVIRNSAIADGFVEVKFKPLAGKEDQAGGLIWPATDHSAPDEHERDQR